MSLTKVVNDGLQSSEMVVVTEYNWSTDRVKNVREKKENYESFRDTENYLLQKLSRMVSIVQKWWSRPRTP